MKILPRDLSIFMLVTVFEESICWAIIYLIKPLYEKGTERVLF
jgi:hypothetical protein